MSELDGRYQVTTTTNYQGPLEKQSDGQTEIIDGKTSRRDAANCLWTSTFTLISPNEVEMVSLADPREAKEDFALVRMDGSPTREPVEYRSVLKYARKDERVQISGTIQYGDEVVFITMRKIVD
jgi:hypothetical protein